MGGDKFEEVPPVMPPTQNPSPNPVPTETTAPISTSVDEGN